MTKEHIIEIPNHFSFINRGVLSFDAALSVFDWRIKNEKVLIDFSRCLAANYQTLSLVTLYVWHLKTQGCSIDFHYSYDNQGATTMWRLMGAVGWSQVLFRENEEFRGHEYKPLIALRTQKDFGKALLKAETYSKGFNVEYEKTLRYVVSELLYNTLEHGISLKEYEGKEQRIPSLVQFTWYRERNELHFIIADLGIGIKKHLEQAYQSFEDDVSAIKKSIRPRVSGTFKSDDLYKSQDNAGIGLYLSSNIVRRLSADMFIVSGKGLVHISPRDTTTLTLDANWPGTFVLIKLRLGSDVNLNLQKIMSEIRGTAKKELAAGKGEEVSNSLYISIENYFGSFAENKAEAINYRDKHIFSAITLNKNIVLDFNNVTSSPHSFLSALLATPIKRCGMEAYKKFKVVNALPEIRETIDYIMDENT